MDAYDKPEDDKWFAPANSHTPTRTADIPMMTMSFRAAHFKATPSAECITLNIWVIKVYKHWLYTWLCKFQCKIVTIKQTVATLQTSGSNIIEYSKVLHLQFKLNKIRNRSMGNVIFTECKYILTWYYHVALIGRPVINWCWVCFRLTFQCKILAFVGGFQLIWYREHRRNCIIFPNQNWRVSCITSHVTSKIRVFHYSIMVVLLLLLLSVVRCCIRSIDVNWTAAKIHE